MKKNTILGLATGLVIGVVLTLGVGRITADKPPTVTEAATSDEVMMNGTMRDSAMSMDSMVGLLKKKTGDDFDREFISQMIAHHQGAIDMANLVANRAKHQEIKDLADDIVTAQSTEISQMKTWYGQWGYRAEDLESDQHAH